MARPMPRLAPVTMTTLDSIDELGIPSFQSLVSWRMMADQFRSWKLPIQDFSKPLQVGSGDLLLTQGRPIPSFSIVF